MSTWPRKAGWSAILDRADKIGTERHGGGTFSAPFFFRRNQQQSHNKVRNAMENNVRTGVGRLHASFLWFMAASKVFASLSL
ncbi:hypothetical protein MGG_16817 [Pyricularia oryzae 70-15]|nr:uncharacterized protein MGG_16817 [Pyricularia oryzae 70-15]ELQ34742.1 hypothetical protein OOU_Y34scaffold00745g16 [Pyricularia oryzae Y34]KAI7916688.1 hypothetical protein M0657_008461 [Pyricularia oryzae]EHA52525.1 hypothetical protein MGG_16817 [Pyricularia oryzae 70-15]KAI7923365.1 hypothetical protein M9X92_004357 [Pyricularia oryzae]QBZ59148.1 hypothetical protein PoMZ_04108 [Pyricularia oryzae]